MNTQIRHRIPGEKIADVLRSAMLFLVMIVVIGSLADTFSSPYL